MKKKNEIVVRKNYQGGGDTNPTPAGNNTGGNGGNQEALVGSSDRDYFTYKMYGLDDERIYRKVMNDPTINVTLGDKEFARKSYNETAKKIGIKPSDADFEQRYETYSNQYKNYKQGVYDNGLGITDHLRTWTSPWAELKDPGGYHQPRVYNIFGRDTRWRFDQTGKVIRQKTDQQLAYDMGYYLPIVNEGDEDSGYDPNKRNYKTIVTEDGQEIRVGDLDKDGDEWFGPWGAGLFPGPESNTVLIVDYDGEGVPVAREVSAHDDVYNSDAIFASNGPKAMYSTWYENLWDQVVVNTLAQIPSGIVGLTDWINDVLQRTNSQYGIYTFSGIDHVPGRDDDFLDQGDKYFKNLASWASVSTPQDVLDVSWNDNGTALAWHSGAVIGQILEMVITRKLPTKLAAARGVTDIEKLHKLQKLGTRLGAGLMAIQAADGLKRTGYEIGLTEDQQTLLYGPMLATAFAVERFGPNILDDGLQRFLVKSDADELIKREIIDIAAGSFGKTAKELTEEETKAASKMLVNRLLGHSKNLGKKTWELTKRGGSYAYEKMPTFMKAALEEGTEEVIEGRLEGAYTTINDYIVSSQNREARIKADRYKYEAKDGKYYEWDKKHQQRREISKETYEKNVNMIENIPEGGMFNYYNHNDGFFSNYWNNTKGEIAQEFWLGAIGGGFMGSIQGITNAMNGNTSTRPTRDGMIADFIVSGNQDILYKKADEAFGKVQGTMGTFGPTDVTSDGKLVDENDPNSISIHEENYRIFKQELDESVKLFETIKKEIARQGEKNGRPNPRIIEEMMSNMEGKALLREAFEYQKFSQGLQREIEALNNEMAENVGNAEKTAELEEQLKDLQRQKKDLSLQLKEITSGRRVKENQVNTHLKHFSAENDTYMVAPDGSNHVPPATAMDDVHKRYDRKRAETIEQVKERSKQRKEFESKVLADDFMVDPDISGQYAEDIGDYDTALGKIADLQRKATDLGISEAGREKLIKELQAEKEAILESIPDSSALEPTEEEVAAFKEQEEIMGMTAEDYWMGKLEQAPAGSARNSAFKLLNEIDNTIKNFEASSEVKVGDNVQWKIDGREQFGVPRKVQSIEEFDGEQFAMVEGREEAIPLSQLSHYGKPQGITPQSPVQFNEDDFKSLYYDTYVDRQGNEISITESLKDLASRTLNEEDLQNIELLERSIRNNSYVVNASRYMSEVGKQHDIGHLKPSAEAEITDAQAKRIQEELMDKAILLESLKIKQGLDVNDKKNKESRLRLNDYKIKNDIINMITALPNLDKEVYEGIEANQARVRDLLNEAESFYADNGNYPIEALDQAHKIIVDIESDLHNFLKGQDSKKVAKELTLYFEKYKNAKKKKLTYLNADEFTDANYDDAYTYQSFSMSTPEGLMTDSLRAKQQFARVYFQNYIQNIARLDSKSFYSSFQEAVNQIRQESGVLPSFEQMEVIKHVYGLLVNPDNAMLMDLEEAITGQSKSDKTSRHMINDFLSRSLFVRGFAGTGKTSLIIKTALSMYSSYKGRNLNIDLSAPSTELQSALASNMMSIRQNGTDQGYNINQLIDRINNNIESFKNTDVIVIDEASSISTPEFKTLVAALKGQNVAKPKVIFLGDQSQMTDINQQARELLAVERKMERTMPTTQVFRSGAADINNFQNAFRINIFSGEEVTLPKGTYDSERNNGLEYFSGSKSQMYDRFADDLNSQDKFKQTNSVLIVYTEADKNAAKGYIQSKINNPNLNLDSVIKTMEKGESYVQGLEFPRIFVAIEKADAKHLYNRAMLTAATRAKKYDDSKAGYALVLSPTGYSEEGTPIIVETSTATDDQIQRMDNFLSSITGSQTNPVGETGTPGNNEGDGPKQNTKLQELSDDQFKGIRNQIKNANKKGKLKKAPDLGAKFKVGGVEFRYVMDGKGLYSVTERKNQDLTNPTKDFNDRSYSLRGQAAHKIVEAYLTRQAPGRNKLFLKSDKEEITNLIQAYNEAVDKHNKSKKAKLSKIEPIGDDADSTFENHPFINDVIQNVAIPIAQRLTKGGSRTLPETIAAVYINDVAGTIDIVDVVGIEDGIPVLDIYDLKTLTPGSHEFFEDTNEADPFEKGFIKMPDGSQKFNNGLNAALAQLGGYARILTKGDEKSGRPEYKIRNVGVVKAMIKDNASIAKVEDTDFIVMPYDSQEFAEYKAYGESMVDNNILPEFKDKNVRNYDDGHSDISQMFVNNNDPTTLVEVTGVYKDVKGTTFYEINHDKESPLTETEFKQMFSTQDVTSIDTLNQNEANGTPERIYKEGAMKHAAGYTFAYGNASQSPQKTFQNTGVFPDDAIELTFRGISRGFEKWYGTELSDKRITAFNLNYDSYVDEQKTIVGTFVTEPNKSNENSKYVSLVIKDDRISGVSYQEVVPGDRAGRTAYWEISVEIPFDAEPANYHAGLIGAAKQVLLAAKNQYHPDGTRNLNKIRKAAEFFDKNPKKESQQGTIGGGWDLQNDHVNFKNEFIKSIKSRLNDGTAAPAVNITFHENIELLNDDGEPELMNNVLLVKADSKTLGEMARFYADSYGKSVGNELNFDQALKYIQDNNYNVIATLPQPEIDFGKRVDGGLKTGEPINYKDKGAVEDLLKKIREGFKGDKNAQSQMNLRSFNLDLAGFRAKGAGQEQGFVGRAKLKSLRQGSVQYGEYKQSWTALKGKLKDKGFQIGTPYWTTNYKTITNAKGKPSKIATWAVDVWKVGPAFDKSTIILQSPEYDSNHYNLIKGELNDLKGTAYTGRDVLKTKAYKLFQQNRGYLIDPDTKAFDQRWPELAEHLYVKNEAEIGLRGVNQKTTPAALLKSLESALDIMDKKISKIMKGKIVQTVDFTSKDKKLNVKAEQESQLLTRAEDVNNYGFYLGTDQIDVSSITHSKGGIVDQTDSDFLRDLGKFNIDPNKRSFSEVEASENDGEYNPDTNEDNPDVLEDPEERKDSFMKFAKNIYGDHGLADEAKKHVAQQIIKFSNFNRDLNTPAMSISDTIANVVNWYKAKSQIIENNYFNLELSDGSKDVKTYADVNGTNASKLKGQQPLLYTVYTFGKNTEALISFINSAVPSLNLSDKKIKKLGVYLAEQIQGDDEILKSLNETSQTNMMDNLDERNFTDTLSDLVKLHIRHTPLRYYTDENTYEVDLDGRTIDEPTIFKVLSDASQKARFENENTKGFNDLQKLKYHLREIFNNAGVGTPTYNTVRSFYEDYFGVTEAAQGPTAVSEYTDPSKKLLSHEELRMGSMVNVATGKSNLAILGYDPDVVKAKGIASDNLISAIITHFGSVTTRSTIDVYSDTKRYTDFDEVTGETFTTSSKFYNAKKSSMAIGSHISQSIKSRLDNTLFSIVDGEVMVSERIRERLVGKNNDISVTSSGVTLKIKGAPDKQVIKFVKGKNKSQIVSFELGENVRTSDIKTLFNLFNIGKLVYDNAINRYMDTVEDTDQDNPDLKVDQAKIAEIAGMWMLTAKEAVDPSISIRSLLEKYYEENAYKTESLDELNEDSTIDSAEIGEEFYKPTDMWRLTQNLGKVQSDSELGNNAMWYYTVDGKKVYRNVNASTIDRLFPNSQISGKNSGSGLKEMVKTIIERTTFDELSNNPNFELTQDESGAYGLEVLNPYLNPESDWEVVDMVRMGGLANERNGSRHGRQMTELDFAEFVINGLFVEDVARGNRIPTFRLPYHNTSNKAGVPVFDIKLPNNPFTLKDGSISVDRQWVKDNVINIFRIINNQRKKSASRIVDVIGNIPGTKLHQVINDTTLDAQNASQQYNEIVESFIADPNTMKWYLADLQTGANRLDIVDAFKRSDLVIDSDYTIRKLEDGNEYVFAGPSAMMEFDRVYNWNNFSRLKRSAEVPKAKRDLAELIEGGFYDEEINAEINTAAQAGVDLDFNAAKDVFFESQLQKDLKEKGITEDKNVDEMIKSIFFRTHMDAANHLKKEVKLWRERGGTATDRITETDWAYPDMTKKTPKGYTWWDVNPTLESFFYMYHFNDFYLSQIVDGNTMQYKGVDNYFKRGSGAVAPLWVVDTSTPRGVGMNTNIAILEDISTQEYDQLRTIFNAKSTTEDTDGLSFENPIYTRLLKNSLGGNELGVMGVGMGKPVYKKTDLATNDSLYIKYASLELTEGILRNSAKARDYFRKMMPGPVLQQLYKSWENGTRTLDEITEEVISTGRASEILGQAVFRSGVKTGARAIQNIDDDVWNVSTTLDNRFFGIQLNAAQDVEKTDKQSQPTQLLAEMGVGSQNIERVGQINSLKAKISDDAISNMMKKFVDEGGLDPDAFANWLKDIGIQQAEQVGELTQYTELLFKSRLDGNISLNLPNMGKIKQQLINQVTKHAIRPKANGVKMSQAPAFFFDVYESEDGNIYMEKEVEKGEFGDTPLTQRQLRPMEFYYTDQPGVKIESLEEFDNAVAAQNVYVKPAEIILPLSYIDQFGFREYLEENPDFSLNDAFMFRRADGKLVNLKKVSDEDLKTFIESQYRSEEGKNGDTFIQQKYKSAEKAIAYVQNLRETTKLVLNRVPTSKASGGFIGEAIGWINDNGNTVYTSSLKNILDGGDYDIDALSVFFKSVGDTGRILDKGVKGDMNSQFDLMYEYYTDPSNAKIYMSPINLNPLRRQVADKKAQMERFQNNHHDFGTNAFYYDNIFEGDKMIGVFANIIKNFSYTTHALETLKAQNIQLNQRLAIEDIDSKVIADRLEGYLNAATDNAKELILGTLGATIESSNIIGAAAMLNYTYDQISTLLDQDSVRQVFDRIKYSRRVSSFKKMTIADAIEAQRESLEGNAQDEMDAIKDKMALIEATLAQPDSIVPPIFEEAEIKEDGTYVVLVTDRMGLPERFETYTPEQYQEIKQNMISNMENELENLKSIENDPEPYIREQLDQLGRLEDLSHLGEAVIRLNNVVKFDSQGIPVFDYKLNQQLGQIEYALNQTIDDFTKGRTNVDPKFWESKKAFLPEEDLEKLRLKEEAIRSYIDIPGIVKALPHVVSYLDAVNKMTQWMDVTFIKNSEFVQGLMKKYLRDNKLNDWMSEQSYYSFFKEFDKFNVALYFSTNYNKNTPGLTMPPLTGTKAVGSYDLSTTTGRYRFGTEFPSYVMKLKEDAYGSPNPSAEQKLLTNNVFLDNLTIRDTNINSVLEIKNASKLTKGQLIDMRADFSKLPRNLKEKFYAYQLMKDGFNFKTNTLYQAMDNEIFVRFSEFLNKVETAIFDDPDFTFSINTPEGEVVSRSYERMMDVFMQDALYNSDDKALLQNYEFRAKLWSENPELAPKFFKKNLERSQGLADHVTMTDRDTGEMYMSKVAQTFNSYNPLESNLTMVGKWEGGRDFTLKGYPQVMKKFGDLQNYIDAGSGNPIKITFKNRPAYRSGMVYMPDGSTMYINRTGGIVGNTVNLRPHVPSAKAIDEYKSNNTKEGLLRAIQERTKHDGHRLIADLLLKANESGWLDRGLVSWLRTDEDADFKEKAEKGATVGGHFNWGTTGIKINLDTVYNGKVNKSDPSQYSERVFLHEMLHNFTVYALNIDQDIDLSKFNTAERARVESALKYQRDIKKLYDHVKSKADVKDAEGNPKFENYGFKNLDEFVAEAYTNDNLQKFMKGIDGIPEAEIETEAKSWLSDVTDEIKSAWNQFLNGIKSMFGDGTPNQINALDQVIGITNDFIQEGKYEFMSAMDINQDNKIVIDPKGGSYMIAEAEYDVPEAAVSKDIINSLQPSGVIKNFSEYRVDELIDTIYSNIDPKTKTYWYSGEKFYFKDMDEMASKQFIKEEIVPKFTEFEQKYKNTMMDWLSSGAETNPEISKDFFPTKDRRSRYNADVLAEVKKKMDYDKTDVFMRYSEFKDSGNQHIPYIEAFEGYDPIIVIHKSIDDAGRSISIFDITSLRLGKKFLGKGNLFRNFMDDKEAMKKGVSFGNNEGDMRRMLLTLQVMAMKQANPELKIKLVEVMGVHSNDVESSYVLMDNYMDNIKAMREIEPLYEALSPEIRDVIDDDTLYEEDYDQPWLYSLRREYQQRQVDLSTDSPNSWEFRTMKGSVSRIEEYLSGVGSREDILEMVKWHMLRLEKQKNPESLKDDREYALLGATLKQLTKTPVAFERISTNDLNLITSYTATTHNIEHEIVNWVQEKTYQTLSKNVDTISKWQKNEFNPLLRAYDERYFLKHPDQRKWNFLQNLAGDKFKPLFKTRMIKDINGNDVEVNSGEIHWDKNDPETKKLIADGTLAPGDVELGKFVVDTLEKEMIKNLIHQNRYFKNKYTEQDAKEQLEKIWRKGMVPMISKSVNEMLMKMDTKNAKQAYEKFMYQLSNMDDLYDEANVKQSKDSKKKKILTEMSDIFMSQTGVQSDVFGSDTRMSIMGIDKAIGGHILTDQFANESLSTNLEMIMNLMMSSSNRKRIVESELLPIINGGQAILHNAELMKLEGDQEKSIQYLTSYVNSVIKGQAETTDINLNLPFKEAPVNVDKFVNQALQVTSAFSLGLNVPLGMTSALMNANQFMNTAIANDMSGSGVYGRKDAQKALNMLASKTGRELFEAIMEEYQVADMTERDLMHNPRKKVMDKNLFTSHTMHWTNWITDYYVRGLAAVAAMQKDGSIAAYSVKNGKLAYDENLDPRWEGEDGQAMKEFIKNRLVEDGFMNSVDEAMPRGYELMMQRQLKTIADKYIVGSMDALTQTRLSRGTVGRLFMQYRSYLPDKLYNYFDVEKYSPVEGEWTKKDGEYVWEQRMTKGMVRSMSTLFTELKKAKYNGKEAWMSMSKTDKYNVSRLLADTVSAAIMSFIYAGLTQVDWDDDKKGKQNLLPDSRFLRTLKYGALDLMLWQPSLIADAIVSVPLLETIGRYWEVATGSWQEIDRLVPFSSTVKAVGEVIPEGEE